MAKDIEQILEETKRHFDEKTEDTKRHFGVVAERLEDKIGIVSEQVAGNAENITSVQKKLEEHDQRFNKIEGVLEVIKVDIEFIKHGLKQKVDRDEFAVLEKRVSLLEAKASA